MHSKKDKPEQLTLFDLDDLVKDNLLEKIAIERLPDFPVTEVENRIINFVKLKVQEICKQDPSVQSIKLELDPMSLAKNRHISNISDYKERIYKTVERMHYEKKMPGESIRFKGKDGNMKLFTFQVFRNILTDEKTKKILIQVSDDYIDYTKYVLPNPEVKLLKTFINRVSTKYTNHFVNFIIDQVGNLRKKSDGPETLYEVVVKKENIKKFIPTDAKYTDNKYVSKVLLPAILDVNNQEFAPFEIINPDNIVIKNGRSHYEYKFIVKMKKDTASQPMFINIDQQEGEIIDEKLVPYNWIYIDFVLRRIGADERLRRQIRADNDRERAWKTYLYVATKDKERRNGGYLNRAYSEYFAATSQIPVLVFDFCKMNPELIDEVIEEIEKKIKENA